MPRRRRRRPARSPLRFLPSALAILVLFALVLVSMQRYPLLWVAAGGAMTLFVGLLVLYHHTRRRYRTRTLRDLVALPPAQFESVVAQLLKRRGYRDVRRVGGAGDLAADITCRDREGRRVIVQCKRYAAGNRVGSKDIQTFIGMISVHHQADVGIFVTTSDFTEPARELAERHGLQLVNGDELARWLRV